MRILFLFLSFSFLISSNSTKSREGHIFVIGESNLQMGIWDITTKDWFIPCKYEDIYPFKNGKAAFKKNGKWGFINMSGKEVIKAQYDDVYNKQYSEDGFCLVKIGKKWGCINLKGTQVSPFIFDELKDSNTDILPVKINGKFGYANKKGGLVINAIFIEADIKDNGFGWAKIKSNTQGDICCMIYKNGNVNWCDSLYSNIVLFNQGNAVATMRNDGSKVVINSVGKILHKFSSSLDLIPTVRRYFYSNSSYLILNSENKYGLSDMYGKNIIDPIYDSIIDLGEGYYSYRIRKKFGLCDSTGNIITDTLFKKILPYSENYAPACLEEKKWGYIDKTGKWVISPIYMRTLYFFNGFGIINENEKLNIINNYGEIIFKTGFSDLSYSNYVGYYTYMQQAYSFTESKKLGVINASTKEIVPSPFKNFIYGIYKMQNGNMIGN